MPETGHKSKPLQQIEQGSALPVWLGRAGRARPISNSLLTQESHEELAMLNNSKERLTDRGRRISIQSATESGWMAPARLENMANQITQGCYYIYLQPAEAVQNVRYYHGTLRVEKTGVPVQGTQDTPDPGARQTSGLLRASADIYTRPETISEKLISEIAAANPSLAKMLSSPAWPEDQLENGIPVFPRSEYFGYLQVAPIAKIENLNEKGGRTTTSYSAQFRFHGFDRKTKKFASPGLLTVIVKPAQGDSESQSGVSWGPEFIGQVINENTGQVVGELKLKKVSDYLRQASLVITTIDGADAPKDNGVKKSNGSNKNESGKTHANWTSVFKKAKWQLKVHPPLDGATPEDQIESPPVDEGPQLAAIKSKIGEKLTDSTLMAVMRELRKQDALDFDWRYRLLCVGAFANPEFQRGVTFDVAGIDIREPSTEVAVIAAKWPIPKASDEEAADWENVEARFFQEAKELYFRTAVHEIGHAAGLGHRYSDYGFMNTTDVIAREGMYEAMETRKEAVLAQLFKAKKAISAQELEKKIKLRDQTKEFPDNVEFEFSKRDLERLMHAPDVMVRPGAFNAENLPIFEDEAAEPASEFRLRLSPLRPSVPYGAPVRIELRLENVSDRPQGGVPYSLHLKSGLVSGYVTDSSGTIKRPFEAMMKNLDHDRYRNGILKPGKSLSDDMTLLRGHEGPLFPSDGDYTVTVKVAWRRHGKNVFVEGQTVVRVNPPTDMAQRLAAQDLLHQPQALFALVVGGQYDEATEAVLGACLAHPVLAPHFRVIEVKRHLEKGEVAQAKKIIIDQEIILTKAEIMRLEQMIKRAPK